MIIHTNLPIRGALHNRSAPPLVRGSSQLPVLKLPRLLTFFNPLAPSLDRNYHKRNVYNYEWPISNLILFISLGYNLSEIQCKQISEVNIFWVKRWKWLKIELLSSELHPISAVLRLVMNLVLYSRSSVFCNVVLTPQCLNLWPHFFTT